MTELTTMDARRTAWDVAVWAAAQGYVVTAYERTGYERTATVSLSSYSPRSRRVILDACKEAEAADAVECVARGLQRIGRRLQAVTE